MPAASKKKHTDWGLSSGKYRNAYVLVFQLMLPLPSLAFVIFREPPAFGLSLGQLVRCLIAREPDLILTSLMP